MIKIKKVFLLLLLAVFMLFAFSGCADEQTEDPAAAGEGESITISGLPDGEIKITIDKIKALPAESGEAVSISSSGEESTVPFKGVALNTILEKHGTSLDDYTSVRLVAADGYSVEVPRYFAVQALLFGLRASRWTDSGKGPALASGYSRCQVLVLDQSAGRSSINRRRRLGGEIPLYF